MRRMFIKIAYEISILKINAEYQLLTVTTFNLKIGYQFKLK